MSKLVKRIIWIVVAIAIVCVGYFSFFHTSKSEANTIKVGIMSGSKQEDNIWKQVAKTAEDKYGLKVQFKRFSDYSQPNKALSSGDIDVNAFQNYPFLENWNKANKSDIVAVGDTVIEPMRIYSYKYKLVTEIPKNAKIAVPNDTNNESRALRTLQSAGLIKLNDTHQFASKKDIVSNPKNIKIDEVDASQTPRVLDDEAASVVNGNFAQSSSLNPKKAIYTAPFDKNSHQWVNFIAANKKDKDKKIIKDLVKAYQTEATKKEIKKQTGINQQAAWDLKFK
ncbi:MetQ/NlpA family ABC transporter substrate-binding protein [Lactobacillus sp. S2-2]|uniref:MetQ/NlpA family ABC transporter substrate-binding protein n=1 Tax=Lactobacillus sp. S2-2 TaxID=2692917 RepID=UPI001F46D201|nr:MetQ/NlpA family ABC transporter substrate-binding protein [Lactobacillus sp. S2-2]MCF6515383.1 MetQ/NlpA family ABC transporter substrate-binding protein [Lactobacillus sp. S2-2]